MRIHVKAHSIQKRSATLTLVLLFALVGMIGAPAQVTAVENEVTYTGTNTGIYGDDSHGGGMKGPFNIGFTFNYYDIDYTQVTANINGTISPGTTQYTAYSNNALGSSGQNNTIYAFWDDLITKSGSPPSPSIYYRTVGEEGSRKFIMQWTNMYFYSNPNVQMGTFQVILYEGTNVIQLQYRDLLGGNAALGNSATIGIKKDNANFVQYSNNTANLTEGQAISYTPNGSGGYTQNSAASYDPVYILADGAPESPTLINPQDGTTGSTTTPTFEWQTVDLATSYRVLISTVSNFSSTVVNQGGITGTSYTLGSPLGYNTNYYWRVEAINSVGTSLSSSRSFTTAATPNAAPDEPSNIGPSTYLNGGTVTQANFDATPLTFDLTDDDVGEQIRYRLQISKNSNFSDPVLDYRSNFDVVGSREFQLGTTDGTYLIGNPNVLLEAGESYYLRIRAEDDGAASSSWTGPSGVAFIYQDAPNEAPTVSALGPTNLTNGSWTNDTTPTLAFELADADNDEVKYEIQIDNNADFSSPEVDYESDLESSGAKTFTVGQAASIIILGLYNEGAQGQVLEDGQYYWRVKAVDEHGLESSFSAANSGAICFGVDTVAPTVPGVPATANPTTDVTPTWTWDASADTGSGQDDISYEVRWSQDETFSEGVNFATTTEDSYTHVSELGIGEWFFAVRALDPLENTSQYSGYGTTTLEVEPEPENPPMSPDNDGDGVVDSIEIDGPNDGDANNDGIADAEQANVATLLNWVSDQYVSLVVNGDCNIVNIAMKAEGDFATDVAYTYEEGLMDFRVVCSQPGETITVRKYYYGIRDSELLTVRKFDPTNNSYFSLSGQYGATLETQEISGQNVFVTSYQVTDGGVLDDDNEVNSEIVDPVGLGRQIVNTPNTGLSEKFLNILNLKAK